MIYIPSGAALKCQRHSDVDAAKTACKAENICCLVLYIKSLPPAGLQDEVQTPLRQQLCDIARLPPQPAVPQSSQAQPHRPLQWAPAHLKRRAVSHFPTFCMRAVLSTHLATQALLRLSKTQFMFCPTVRCSLTTKPHPTPHCTKLICIPIICIQQ